MKQFLGIKEKRLFYVYSILMFLFYIGYILLDNYRFKLNGSMSKSIITQKDIENFSQLARWTSNFEVMFLLLFIIVMIFCCYQKNIKVLKSFVAVNLALFIGIVVIGYVLFFITPSPIGNLLEPLIVPVYLIGGLLIYMLWRFVKKRKLVE